MKKPVLNIGPLRPGGAGQHMKHEKVSFELPSKIAAGTTTELYVPSPWPVRPGADDHKRFKSRGV